MPRITPLNSENAPQESQRLIDQAKQQTGAGEINFFKQMAVSPASFKGYLDLAATLSGGALDRQTQEAVAVAVSDFHGCTY